MEIDRSNKLKSLEGVGIGNVDVRSSFLFIPSFVICCYRSLALFARFGTYSVNTEYLFTTILDPALPLVNSI